MTDARPCVNCGAENPAGSRFCNGCGTALEAPRAAVAETRKVVTILFCDAISSTALGERLDPESLRSLMTRYFEVMREVIEDHGGVVEKFIGDAVMAVFGVPAVHEDDALRACSAALEIHERLGALDAAIQAERGATVDWRMGINTGEVVAGDGASGQRIVTGDAVNVAARLESAASRGEILLGADTYALVRGSVVVEALEPLSVKGKAEPVAAWRLLGSAAAASRSTHERPMDAPLVGRRRPLDLLSLAFREVVEDRVCHLFTVLGTAGVGKSRLVDEFVASISDQAQVATGRCLAYGSGITYWPVVEAIRHGLHLADDASAESALTSLGDLLGTDPERGRIEAVIGHLMGLIEQAPPSTEIFWGIRRTFEALARHRPLVLVFDDIHWGEATFLDLVEHIADWTRDAPILLIAMARPELLEERPAWGGGKRSATTVQLEPLTARESGELVGGLLGEANLPADVLTQVSRAAEGNPLFIEELLGKLIDDGFLVPTDGGWAAIGDLRELVIPPTIQALMAARLDSLGRDERTVIERASVEGKTFHRGAVTELAPDSLKALVSDRLASLTRMELLRPDQASFVGEEAYQFRHLLIRDAAYQALAKQTRSELHERFAGWLERTAADRLTEYEEILGYHFEQAYRYRLELGPADDHTRDLADRAGSLLAAAARRAGARQDVTATIDLLERTMDVLPPDSAERRLLVAQLGYAFLPAGDAGRAETLLEQTRREAAAANDLRASAWAATSLLWVRNSTSSIPGADTFKEAERLRDQFRNIGDLEGAAQAELTAAMALFIVGRAGEAMARANAVFATPGASLLNRAEAARWEGVAAVFGPSPTNTAISLIRGQVMPFDLPGAHFGLARMLVLQGKYAEARQAAAEAAHGLEQMGDRLTLSDVDEVMGDIVAAEGDVDAAIAHFRSSYDAKVALGDRGYASTTAARLAQVLIQAARFEEAEQFAAIALDTSSHDDIASQAGGKACMARVLANRGEFERAEVLAAEAVAIMAATDYLAWHADVLLDQAHVLRAAGKTEAALGALAQAEDLYRLKEAPARVTVVEGLIGDWSGG